MTGMDGGEQIGRTVDQQKIIVIIIIIIIIIIIMSEMKTKLRKRMAGRIPPL